MKKDHKKIESEEQPTKIKVKINSKKNINNKHKKY